MNQFAGPGRFELVIDQDFERQMKAPVKFILPLLGKAPRANHQAPLQITTGDQLFNEQARHDGLPGAWIVSQQKPQWLARQH